MVTVTVVALATKIGIAGESAKGLPVILNRILSDLFPYPEHNRYIWEFRTSWQGVTYRLLAFWDKGNETLVVATHGFIKKSQKTPPGEIEHAKAIMKEYFNEKDK